jgi:ketosteroid isomerase-like protein
MTDREAIEAQIRSFIDAYNAGDIEGVMRCYSDDLLKLRHGAQPENRRDTEQRVRGVMNAFRGRLTVENQEIFVASDMAYVRGSLRIVLEPRTGGPSQEIERRFLEIWRKENGRWLVTRAIDNSGAAADALPML